jgi:outer membrane protein OmpA-like peptidoglycan-associated protein
MHAIVAKGQQAPVYRVTCDGLFESSNSCMKAAAEMCADKPVTPLESVDGVKSGINTKNPREITFQCGAPPQPVAAAAPAPARVPARVPAPVPKAVSLGGDAQFDTGKATLRPDAMDRLDTLANEARGVTFSKVMVSGYTDSTGSDALNQPLSERRAQVVADYLRARGLQANSWVVYGYGKAEPVASDATAAGRAQNRRIEVRMN